MDDEFPITDVYYINDRYKAFNNTGDNIYFFTQSEDPWKKVCMWDKKFVSGTQKQSYVDCDNCSHCQEIYPEKESDAQSLKDARADSARAIKKWLADDALIKKA